MLKQNLDRVVTVLLMLVVMGPCAPLISQAAENTVLKIATSTPQASLVSSSVNQYLNAVNKITAGRLKLQIVTAGKDAGPTTLIKGLQDKHFAIIEIPRQSIILTDPLLELDAVPFLAMNYPRAEKLWRVVRPHLVTALKARGLRLLYAITTSPPAIISQRPLLHTANFNNGIILDSAVTLGSVAAITGAQLLRVKTGSIASAFKHKGIDFIFVSPSQGVNDQIWRYARNYTPIPAWFPKHLLLMNESKFAQLEKSLRTTLTLTAAQAEHRAWSASEQRNRELIQKLRDQGMQIAKPTVALQLELQALGRKLLFSWSQNAGDAGARLVEDYYAIR